MVFFFFLFWAMLFFNSVSMLLNFFMNISIIIATHFFYLLYFYPCLDLGLIMSYRCHLFFIFIFIFIMIDRIILWMQTHLFFRLFSRICLLIFGWKMWINFQLAKVQPQGIAKHLLNFFGNFSLALLIKVLLMKKRVSTYCWKLRLQRKQ